MAKIYGLFGAMSGKVADVVMSVRNGEQLVRKYQPVVFNPQTSAQMQVRAKLKLMSQLGAVLGSNVMGFARGGGVSKRNRFVAENFGNVNFENGTAYLKMSAVKLTDGSARLEGVSVTSADQQIVITYNPTSVIKAVKPDVLVAVSISQRVENKVSRFIKQGEVVRVVTGVERPVEITLPLSLLGQDVYVYGISYDDATSKRLGELLANNDQEGLYDVDANVLVEAVPITARGVYTETKHTSIKQEA